MAQHRQVLRKKKYKVTWLNYDDAVLEVDNDVVEGAMPVYNGDIPLKPDSGASSFTFKGWGPAVVKVTADATYRALYDETVIEYEITWEDYDGTLLKTTTVLRGDVPVYDGATPTRTATTQYTFAFDGWTPEVVAATQNTKYTAKYIATTKTFTVAWVNNDNTPLEVDEEVPYGTMPTYDSPLPTFVGKPFPGHHAVFDGWDPEITVVTRRQLYTAKYKMVPNTYTITWKNYDGTTLETDLNVVYQSTPTYDGAIPTRPSDATYVYTFSGWSPAVAPATANTVYTAQFATTGRYYTVSWDSMDGFSLGHDQIYELGQTPVYPGLVPYNRDDTDVMYQFTGWTPQISPVNQDITYSAVGQAVDPQYVFEYSSNGTEITIEGLNLSGIGRIIIPDMIDGLPVRYIADNAFTNNLEIQSVVTNANLVTIGQFAFSQCTNLEQVHLANGLNNILSRAFALTGLANISIPDSVVNIGTGALSDCYKLTSIGFPTNATLNTIPIQFASNCPLITTLYIPDTITTISELAFYNNSTLTQIFANKVETIGNSAFKDCVSLPSINFPLLKTIGERTFFDCRLLQYITLPAVQTISASAFENCNLIALGCPHTLAVIGPRAFANNPLTNAITFGNAQVVIQEEAFSNILFAGRIYLPGTVVTVQNNAFSGPNITGFNCGAASLPPSWGLTWNPTNLPVTWGYVPA